MAPPCLSSRAPCHSSRIKEGWLHSSSVVHPALWAHSPSIDHLPPTMKVQAILIFAVAANIYVFLPVALLTDSAIRHDPRTVLLVNNFLSLLEFAMAFAVGLALIVAFKEYETIKRQRNASHENSVHPLDYPDLKDEEFVPFTKWLHADYARKSYSKKEQVNLFRGQ